PALGVTVEGSDATLDSSVIRANGFNAPVKGADVGVQARSDSKKGQRATLTMTSSVVEKNTGIGVEVDGADASIDACVIRDSAKERGVDVGPGEQGEPAQRPRRSNATRSTWTARRTRAPSSRCTTEAAFR